MSLTCVTGYWNVKNKHNDKYNEWFKNTLSINCPYIIFTDINSIDMIKECRQHFPTYYINCNIEDFYTFKYKDKMIVNDIHCPSVELNLVWNEKIFMIQKAAIINPFNSDWFKWIDAGTCIYRNVKPSNIIFPDNDKLCGLPTDKFIYSSSNKYIAGLVSNTNCYHHISGTSYILHKSMINMFTELYKTYLDKLLDKNNIWTDQVILTHIYRDHPKLFFKLCDGYGTITKYLYT